MGRGAGLGWGRAGTRRALNEYKRAIRSGGTQKTQAHSTEEWHAGGTDDLYSMQGVHNRRRMLTAGAQEVHKRYMYAGGNQEVLS